MFCVWLYVRSYRRVTSRAGIWGIVQMVAVSSALPALPFLWLLAISLISFFLILRHVNRMQLFQYNMSFFIHAIVAVKLFGIAHKLQLPCGLWCRIQRHWHRTKHSNPHCVCTRGLIKCHLCRSVHHHKAKIGCYQLLVVYFTMCQEVFSEIA